MTQQDERGSSINLQYGLALALGLILLAGFAGFATDNVDTKSDQVSQSKMNIIAEQTSTKLLQVYNRKQKTEANGDVERIEQRVRLPSKLNTNNLIVTVYTTGSNTKLIVRSSDPQETIKTEKTLPSDISTETTTVPANDIWIVYDESEGNYKLSTT